MTGIAAAPFAVHFFGAHASVNSPLQCWVLGGEWSWLWKSLNARTNGPSTNAIDAYVINKIELSGKNLLRDFICHDCNEQRRTG